MGITLSFQGRQADPTVRAEALAFADSFARDMEWAQQTIAMEFPRGKLGDQILECPRIEGLALLPHFACEPVPLIFHAGTGILVDWYVHDEGQRSAELASEPILKTQFAGPGVHEEICDFLEQLRRRFVPDLLVDDESGFFGRRDRPGLEAEFERAWRQLSEVADELRSGDEESFAIGGVEVFPGDAVRAPEPLGSPQLGILAEAERWLMTRYGAFGNAFDHSESSLTDLELLMSDADEEGWRERPEDPEVEAFVHAAGAYFGQTLLALLGGQWHQEEEEGLVLRAVGGVGLRVDPFQVAASRLVVGPPFGFPLHLELFATLARHLK